MSEPRFIWRAGHGTVMHVAEYDRIGNLTMRSLCAARIPFNRTINMPFRLGRPVCKRCAVKSERQSGGGR